VSTKCQSDKCFSTKRLGTFEIVSHRKRGKEKAADFHSSIEAKRD
jgi:hypothetical protein